MRSIFLSFVIPLVLVVALIFILVKERPAKSSFKQRDETVLPVTSKPNQLPVLGPPHGFNIDFGVWRPTSSKQTGPAAAGEAGDYWNTVGVAWNNDHTEGGLKSTKGESSPIQVRMVNLAGGWSNNGGMGVKDPMLDTYNYPVNNQGGNSQVILSRVPAGIYDLYLYGHGASAVYYGDYAVTVGARHYGRKVTSNSAESVENTKWVEGNQYVKFTSVQVASGDNIEILIQPGGQVTDNLRRTFSDAMICGLQLIPVSEKIAKEPEERKWNIQ